jgi:hypothetical protein
MNTIMIDYDLVIPGQKKSTWLIRTDKTHVQVRDDILRIIDGNDKVLVTDVTRAQMAWEGLSSEVSEWIKINVGRSPVYR